MGRGKYKTGIIATYLLLLSQLPLVAQTYPTSDQYLPVATINQERLFSDSLFGKAFNQAFRDKSNALGEENRRIEKELTTEETDLTEKRKTLSNEDFRELAVTFNDKVETIRRDQAEKLQNLNGTRIQAQVAFFVKAKPVIIDMMNERGIMFILNDQAIFMAGNSGDITDSAIKRINQVLGSAGLQTQD